MTRRHDYRLGTKDTGWFAGRLESALAQGPLATEEIEGFPQVGGSARYAFYRLFDEDRDPFFFELMLHQPTGDPAPETLETVRRLFASLIAMDDAARAAPCQYDENEELARVMLYPADGAVMLHYYSNLWNSEWDVRFRRDGDGWSYVGLA